MKRHLCPNGKGKIHPSPAPPQVEEGFSSRDALAVLKLLPAAIVALAAALTCEDKEVLAYLIMHSIQAAAAEVMAQATASAHRPLLGCGCFDCYTSFWSRWDSSPDRELIHRAIDAFEEHLACSEKTGGGGGGGGGSKGRRREKSDGVRREKEEVEEIEAEVVMEGEEEEEEEESVKASMVASEAATFSVEMNEAMDAAAVAAVGNGEEMAAAAAAAAVLVGERRRFWPGVMGLINYRLWSFWGPAM